MQKSTAIMNIMLVLAAFTMGGCSSKNEVVQINDSKSDVNDAPRWVALPPKDGYIVEIGSASPNSKNDLSFQRAEAMADARDNLARLLKTEINNQIKSSKGKNNEGELGESHKHTSSQIVELSLRMSQQQALWVSKSGQMFVLVGIDKETLKSNINKNLMK